MIRSNKKFIPVMLMPFTEGKEIDYEALSSLIEFYIKAGAQGLFANCLSSEMFNLSKEEMLETVSFIVDKVDGRVPIVATGTFEGTIESQASFVREMYATGIDTVIVITGLLAKESDDEDTFKNNVYQLLELTDNIPLGFYECPLPYKRIMPPVFLGELVRTGRIKYHKDTSLDLANIQAKVEATQGIEGFGLYDAYMGHAVKSLKAGSAGLSCIQGNYFPELIVWLCNNYDNESQKDKVAEVQSFLNKNMDIMHYAYPASAKYYLKDNNIDIKVICRREDIENLDEEIKLKLNELKLSYKELDIN